MSGSQFGTALAAQSLDWVRQLVVDFGVFIGIGVAIGAVFLMLGWWASISRKQG